MAHAEFLFDFASPNAYLSHKVIPAIEARTGATFQYTPVLLGGLFKLTGNQAPIDVKTKLMASTEDAAKRGAFGIPTFFVGGQIYFGKDRLRDVEEALAR